MLMRTAVIRHLGGGVGIVSILKVKKKALMFQVLIDTWEPVGRYSRVERVEVADGWRVYLPACSCPVHCCLIMKQPRRD